MQRPPGQNIGRTPSSTRTLITFVIIIFALAGLIAGFAFGEIGHSKAGTPISSVSPTAQKSPASTVIATATATATPTPVVLLGVPEFQPVPTLAETPDGTTLYSVGIQAIDKHNSPVSSSNVTCKVWLIKQIPNNQKLSISVNVLKSVQTLSSTITGTVNNMPAPEVTGLTFTPAQTGLCNAHGQLTWKYSIATTVPAGKYDLVVLADWQGMHWNWSWINITIQ